MGIQNLVALSALGGYLLQVAALFLWWLVTNAPEGVKHRWRPFGRTPKAAVLMLFGLAAVCSGTWPIAATEAPVQPAIQLNQWLDAILSDYSKDMTISLLMVVAFLPGIVAAILNPGGVAHGR